MQEAKEGIDLPHLSKRNQQHRKSSPVLFLEDEVRFFLYFIGFEIFFRNFLNLQELLLFFKELFFRTSMLLPLLRLQLLEESK